MKITELAAKKQESVFEEQPAMAHRKVPLRVWVLVADSHKAIIYRKRREDLEVVVRIEPDHEFIRTKAQRNAGHTGGGQGSVHYTSNPLDHEDHHDEKAFMKALGGWLEKAERDKAFDELILAAPPRTLGNLREALNKSVTAKIKTALHKDLVHMPAEELEEYLESVKS